jgi:transitional endoplasmic reticulum ATPase
MPLNDDAIAGIREALRVSPDNLPLRQALADALTSCGRYDEAEVEYRQALSLAPQNLKLKIGLGNAFYLQGKNSQALVIVEDLLKAGDAPAGAFLLHARLLVRSGAIDRAIRQYKLAVSKDPALADDELTARLGIGREAASNELVNGRLRAGWEDSAERIDQNIERPKITFADVGGMEAVKEDIRLKIVHPLQHAGLYAAYGKKAGGGILMYGPPGCGKTHLARATAGEIHANFIAVGISDVLDMWIGSSERNLRALFEQARRSRPCVLFFDEVDALAASRADMRASAGRHMINQFLAEMDGIGASNEGVLILAATNAPWHVDPAFRRPGRFDRIIFVPPPDAPARDAILRIHLKDKPLDHIDHEQLTKSTEDFSGADLKAVVDLAVDAKLQEAIKSGKPSALTTNDLLAAASRIKSSTQEWFATARNYARYSNQGGTYDDILKYLQQ